MPLALAAGLLALERTGLDLAVESWFHDPATGGFPLRHAFLLDTVLHLWAKYLVTIVICLTIAGFLLTYILAALKPWRRLLLFLALALTLAPAAVSAMKLMSATHCPWGIEQYGGMVPYTRLFEPAPPAVGPGHCFPAGHASTGFTLMAFYFAGRMLRRRAVAQAGLATGLAAGAVLGAARMAQGAHFLSHILWSGVICWLVILAVYLAVMRKAPG